MPLPRKISEQRNATRAAGKFAPMDRCELCAKPGTLEPAFGGDDSNGADNDPAWGKLICAKCASEAEKRISR